MTFHSYFGFTRTPFGKDIPPSDLFPAEGQAELCARLDYLTQQRGMGLVTGETGCGKSTALRRFTASLDANRFFVIYLAKNGASRTVKRSMAHTKTEHAAHRFGVSRTHYYRENSAG